MRGNTKKKKQFLEFFKRNSGFIKETCEKINIARQTYYDWCNNDPDFKKIVNEVNESFIDHAENKLMTLIDKEHPSAIIFYLKTKGRNRGYVERRELSGPNGEPIITERRLSKEELDEKIAEHEKRFKNRTKRKK